MSFAAWVWTIIGVALFAYAFGELIFGGGDPRDLPATGRMPDGPIQGREEHR